jgi:hypothetical protein
MRRDQLRCMQRDIAITHRVVAREGFRAGSLDGSSYASGARAAAGGGSKVSLIVPGFKGGLTSLQV